MIWNADGEQEYSPRLREAILEVVENQLGANEPPETRQTLKRLMADGYSREAAKVYIAQAVVVEIFNVLKHKQPFDLERYLGNLSRLPEEPWE